ncbi:hypothetical protein EYF80_034696 [Liparis tanakae]|uniref:Uncharacterized protein n=1 Tax=Liparis tanakae TaxID=230148 RepID=A0A4Z2GQY0_9TELE|nr:hypothetical protein EYF80_034696 [Liparis tanakae]
MFDICAAMSASRRGAYVPDPCGPAPCKQTGMRGHLNGDRYSHEPRPRTTQRKYSGSNERKLSAHDVLPPPASLLMDHAAPSTPAIPIAIAIEVSPYLSTIFQDAASWGSGCSMPVTLVVGAHMGGVGPALTPEADHDVSERREIWYRSAADTQEEEEGEEEEEEEGPIISVGGLIIIIIIIIIIGRNHLVITVQSGGLELGPARHRNERRRGSRDAEAPETLRL